MDTRPSDPPPGGCAATADFARSLLGSALVGERDEHKVIDEAIRFAHTLNSKLIAVHVNDPHAGEMSMMMDSVGHKFPEEDIRDLFRKAGHEEVADTVDVVILTSEQIPKSIAKASEDIDVLILGHRKVSVFQEIITDSIDEWIVNKVNCPVLIIPIS